MTEATSTRAKAFRFVQWNFKAAWGTTPWGSDLEIIRAEGLRERRKNKGPQLAGSGRSLEFLNPDEYERFKSLVDTPTSQLTPEENVEVYALLDKCPFLTYVPPWDLDVSGDAGPEAAELALSYAKNMSAWLRERGLSVPTWSRTNRRGGLHGDQLAPLDLASRKLLKVFKTIAQEFKRDLGIPLLSDFFEKENRPLVVLDDRMFNKKPAARAGVWRLPGSRKDEAGYPKTPVDIWQPGCPEIPYVEPAPHPRKPFEERLARETEFPLYNEAMIRQASLTRPKEQLPVPDMALDAVALAGRDIADMIGIRHELRVRMSGWLVEQGIPEGAVAKTVSSVGTDPKDGIEAARSTWFQFKSGQPLKTLKGFKTLPPGAADRLQTALTTDLDKLGLRPRPPVTEDAAVRRETTSFRDRALLAQASRKAGSGKTARTLEAASQCGVFCDVLCCFLGVGGCGKIHSKHPLMCERGMACPYCMSARTRDLADYWAEFWSNRVAIFHITLSDKSLKVAKDFAASTLTTATGKVTYYVAPGHVLALCGHTADTTAMMRFRSLRSLAMLYGKAVGCEVRIETENTKASKGDAIQKALQVRRALESHTRKLLDAGDPEAIAADPWLAGVRVYSCGRNSLIKNPSDKERRALAKKAAEKRRAEKLAMSDLKETEQNEVCCSVMDLKAYRQLWRGTDDLDHETVSSVRLKLKQFPWSQAAALKEYKAQRKKLVFDQG